MKRVKTGGRKAGTPNRVTGELRAVLKDTLHGELEALPGLLGQLEPKDRIDAVIRLMAYTLPKVNAVSSSDGEPFSFDWGGPG